MWNRSGFVLLAFCVAGPTPAVSQEKAPPKEVGIEQLAALGEQIEAWRMLDDNAFLRAEQRERAVNASKQLPGARISFTVVVRQVTRREVFLVAPEIRAAQVSLKHATAPLFGNLSTVEYHGPASARTAHMLSKRMALRIDSEIDGDVAKNLRKDDVLAMRGDLEAVHLCLEKHFQPRAIAVVSNFELVQVHAGGQSYQ